MSIFNNWGLERNLRNIFFPVIIASFVKATVIIFSLLGVSWLTAFHFSGAASICGQPELLQQGDSLSHKNDLETKSISVSQNWLPWTTTPLKLPYQGLTINTWNTWIVTDASQRNAFPLANHSARGKVSVRLCTCACLCIPCTVLF